MPGTVDRFQTFYILFITLALLSMMGFGIKKLMSPNAIKPISIQSNLTSSDIKITIADDFSWVEKDGKRIYFDERNR